MTRAAALAIEAVGACGAKGDGRRESTTVMKNIGQMMKQAQQLQARMGELQEQLAAVELTGASGGGMVQVTVNGKGDVRRVKIDPSLVDPNDVEVLEDLIVAAFNDAKARLDGHVAERMAELTGGLKLPPGFNFPG
jgi:hypothetical protein